MLMRRRTVGWGPIRPPVASHRGVASPQRRDAGQAAPRSAPFPRLSGAGWLGPKKEPPNSCSCADRPSRSRASSRLDRPRFSRTRSCALLCVSRIRAARGLQPPPDSGCSRASSEIARHASNGTAARVCASSLLTTGLTRECWQRRLNAPERLHVAIDMHGSTNAGQQGALGPKEETE